MKRRPPLLKPLLLMRSDLSKLQCVKGLFLLNLNDESVRLYADLSRGETRIKPL